MKPETFEKYLKAERDNFVRNINAQKWNTQLRTAAESLLIAYDQVVDKYLSNQTTTSLSSLIERVEKCKIPDVDPNTYYHGVNVGIEVAVDHFKSMPCIRAKALRKRGTDKWYAWAYNNGYFTQEIPDVRDVDEWVNIIENTLEPADAELVDIEIRVVEGGNE